MTRKQVDLEIEMDTYIGNYEDVIAVSNVHSLLDKIYADIEEQTCSTCRHHVDYSEYYGNCVRNGSPNATEYTWSCAGWEKQDD